jgi:hypothetical protein
MAIERGEESMGRAAARGANAKVAPGLFGSLKDALRAAGRDDSTPAVEVLPPAVAHITPALPPAITPLPAGGAPKAEAAMTAAEAARHARTAPVDKDVARKSEPELPADPPTTRVVRRERAPEPVSEEAAPRTQLVRGRKKIERETFAQDPVVGFLVVVGGPGLGASRPIFEGNNTVGRSSANRIALDFGDDTISTEAQAYIRYDSADRSFLFVPNLAKTNVVSVNDKRPTSAVELKAMDIVTLGRTQVAFVPFCGPEFDWSELSDAKE